MNIQGFYTGREFDADTFFGAHPYEGGTHFAVWAPSCLLYTSPSPRDCS